MQNFDYFRLDGHTLRVFVSICETGSISRTAVLFGLNQSTISHTLDKMRAAVGDPLFVKAGRGITPTEKTMVIMPRVQQIIADIEGLIEPETYNVSLDTRPIVIAIPTPALIHDMKRLHAGIVAAAPGVIFEIRRLAPRDRVKEMLMHDEAEIAIAVSGYDYPSTLTHCHYASEKMIVFYDAACRAPVRTPEEYADARHAVVNFGGGVKSEVEKSLEALGLKRKVSLVAPTASMLGDLIKGTDIIATMPQRLADTAYSGLSQCAPPVALSDASYDLVWHRRYEHSGRHIWLRRMVMNSRLP